MFKKISEAYAVLSNPDRRNKYDKWGQTGKDEDFGFGDDEDFEAFMGMFGMDNMFGDDFEDFISFLEKDDLKFK
jgi:molecular chaperone DnaJ